MEALNTIQTKVIKAIATAPDLTVLDQLRVHYLGKKGLFTEQLKQLGKLPPDERREAGMVINQAKQSLQQAIEQRREELCQAELRARLSGETIDVTLPGRGRLRGGLHPITQTLQRIERLFAQLGFHV